MLIKDASLVLQVVPAVSVALNIWCVNSLFQCYSKEVVIPPCLTVISVLPSTLEKKVKIILKVFKQVLVETIPSSHNKNINAAAYIEIFLLLDDYIEETSEEFCLAKLENGNGIAYRLSGILVWCVGLLILLGNILPLVS